MPFATNRYLNLLRGNASDAWQNGGGATVGAEATEAVEALEKEWRLISPAALPGGGDNQLPALLRVPLGLLRKMVRDIPYPNPNPNP